MMHRYTPVLIAFVVIVLFAGVMLFYLNGARMKLAEIPFSGSPTATSTSTLSIETLITGEWRLVRFDGREVFSTSQLPYDIAFSNRRIAGQFCNVFSASMELDASGALTFGPTQATKRYCDAAPMEIEGAFFALLQSNVRFALDANGVLTFSSEGIAPVFEFIRRPE